MVFTFSGRIYGFDLFSKIEDTFQKIYDEWFSNEYLNTPYSPIYPEDPYLDELENTEKMNTQLELAWVDRVEQALAERRCYIPKKGIRWILYYYEPEFRKDVARSLKLEIGNTDSNKFILEKDKVAEYCADYFQCELKNYRLDYKEQKNDIAPATSKDAETNCKNFFHKYYIEGKNNEEKTQTVEESQLWNDKYRNATLEDSPYDIMSDLWIVAKLLFEESQDPIQPAFYHLPMFRWVEQAAENHKSSTEGNGSNWNGWKSWEKGGQWWGWSSWWNWENGWQWWQWWGWNTSPSWNSEQWENGTEPSAWWRAPSIFDEYDDLIEWLWAASLNLNNWINGNVCNDEKSLNQDQDSNQDADTWEKSDWDWGNTSDGDSWEKWDNGNSWWWTEGSNSANSSEVSDEDFNDYMNYLQSLIDSYTNDDVEKTQLEKTKEEIENCFKGCEWLRLDQKMSCKLMCACGEIDSPIFDPEKNEGLWPLFMIRFCTVPAQNMKFSVWWRKIVSIEEWIKEIYGVVDKLSREWKLWMWTQQYNFLDSTTKKMNIADSFAFSIDIERVDIANRLPNYSKEYREYVAKKNNEKRQKTYGIQNSINDPSTKNRYGVMASHYFNVTDVSSTLNSEISRQKKSDLTQKTQPVVDYNKDSNASRYVSLWNSLDVLIFQQANFWINASLYTQNFYDYAVNLFEKKDEPKK